METKIELSVDVKLYVVITTNDEYGWKLTKVTEIDEDWENDYSTLIEAIEEKKRESGIIATSLIGVKNIKTLILTY